MVENTQVIELMVNIYGPLIEHIGCLLFLEYQLDNSYQYKTSSL